MVNIKNLFEQGKLHGSVIDYGAGRIARNANYLRNNDLKVYAYDPYWGKNEDGWTGISNILPTETFDVGFTSYVLNVVTVMDEDSILSWMNAHCKKQYHITRNLDVTNMITSALQRKDPIVMNFFVNDFKGDVNNINDEVISKFSKFGTKTKNGFQRIPFLEEKGYKLIKQSVGYKVYEK